MPGSSRPLQKTHGHRKRRIPNVNPRLRYSDLGRLQSSIAPAIKHSDSPLLEVFRSCIPSKHALFELRKSSHLSHVEYSTHLNGRCYSAVIIVQTDAPFKCQPPPKVERADTFRSFDNTTSPGSSISTTTLLPVAHTTVISWNIREVRTR
jgi:hypothetical protein